MYITTVILMLATSPVSSQTLGYDFGLGVLSTRDDRWGSAAGFYADAIGPQENRVTWRAGFDFISAVDDLDEALANDTNLSTEDDLGGASWLWMFLTPSGNWTEGLIALNLHYAAFVRISEDTNKKGGLYVGGGPTVTLYEHTWRDYGDAQEGQGSEYTWRSEGGVGIGAHCFAGYEGSFWHVETMYDLGWSDDIDLGGISLRLGIML